MTRFTERNAGHEKSEYAYRCVKDIIDNHKGIKKKYRSEVLQTGARLYNAGLLQTLAFYISKIKKEEHLKMEEEEHFRKLSLHLMKWILRDTLGQNRDTWDDDSNSTMQIFTEHILCNPEMSILYTERAKAISIWLRRFVEGMINKD